MNIVIATIGRSTLSAAIDSCLREGLGAIVVSDGVPLAEADHPSLNRDGVLYAQLGMNYGRTAKTIYYGQIAFTTGCYLSNSEFTGALGDDDEMLPGAGDLYRAAVEAEPEIDIWIPGLLYNDGHKLCLRQGALQVSNVSHPLYRTRILAEIPMCHIRDEDYNIHDYHHIRRCADAGYKIKWLEKCAIAIRPQLEGFRGSGAPA